VLIDAQHVLSAAHCFAFDDTGAWQMGLQFFPNFHPDRPNPVGINFTRYVVGTRVDTGGEFVQSDWGIGRLATPVTGFQPVPIRSAPLTEWAEISSAGYPRDYKHLTPRPSGGLTCTFGSDNIMDCNGKPQTYSRCYWEKGIVDPKCKIYKQDNGELFFDCRTLPGNSGSPLFWSRESISLFPLELLREYFVTGVIHGPPGDPCASCNVVGTNYNQGPSALRFRYAPRFAAGVALARTPDGAARTHVVAVDPVIDRLVGRKHKTGTASADFHYFDLVDAPFFDPQQVEAFNHSANGKPVLLVVTRQGRLYAGIRLAALVAFLDPPLLWISIPLPAGFDKVVDLDPLDEADNTTEEAYALLHPVDSRTGVVGSAFRLQMSWLFFPNFHWQPVPAPSAVRIAAVRRSSGARQLFLLGDAISGARPVFTLWNNSGTSWSSALDINYPTLELVDLDATTTNVGGLQFVTLLGVAPEGARVPGGLVRKSSLGEASWPEWTYWTNPLYAPLVTTPQPPPANIESVTASRWQETGAQRPVVSLPTPSATSTSPRTPVSPRPSIARRHGRGGSRSITKTLFKSASQRPYPIPRCCEPA